MKFNKVYFTLGVVGVINVLLFQNMGSVNVSSDSPNAPPCTTRKVEEILEPATSEKTFVLINCSTKLPPQKKITKRLLFQGQQSSNLQFDCNGAEIDGEELNQGKDMLEISSKRKNNSDNEEWLRPENVAIRNCIVRGSIRIKGMAPNGEGELLRNSSRSLGHTERAQQNAPKNIHLYNMKIFGTGRIPLYFAPGVTYSGLHNSEVAGQSNSVAIYFDTESAFNTLRNNYVHTDTYDSKVKVLGVTVHKSSRELIAVDGSAHNLIVGNRFSSLNNGGIFLYRNCGEGGTIRHQTPTQNQIIDNFFYYNKYDGELPAIWLGSRNGGKRYCDHDKGYNFGSSINNGDFATNNIIAKNQIYKFSPASMIRDRESKNRIFANERVVNAPINRKSACYINGGYPSELLLHGQSTQLFIVSENIVCKPTNYTCDDGVLQRSPKACQSLPETQSVRFECKSDSNNRGCRGEIRCPKATRIVGLKAACNLEYGKVSNTQLMNVAINTLEVLKSSDKVTDGECRLDTKSISSGTGSLTASLGGSRLNFSCKEHDKNGGDCHIVGSMLCQ